MSNGAISMALPEEAAEAELVTNHDEADVADHAPRRRSAHASEPARTGTASVQESRPPTLDSSGWPPRGDSDTRSQSQRTLTAQTASKRQDTMQDT